MNILAVDNREADLTLVVDALHALYPDDCTITQATRLSYARQLLRENTYDLIVLDLSYPDSLDYETWWNIRPLIHDSSVIIYSAYLDEQVMLPLIYEGVHHFVDKCNPNMIGREGAIQAIRREVLKLMAIKSHAVVAPSPAEVIERLVAIETQVRSMERSLYRGNGVDSLVTQMRTMAMAVTEVRADVSELKPLVNALAQLRLGRWTQIILATVMILGALIGPWAASHWAKP